MNKEVNYVITKGGIANQLTYSLFKLLDWRIGSAVCVTHKVDEGVFITDCKQSLQKVLTEKFGGTYESAMWSSEDADIYEVLKAVTEWINKD